MPKLHLVGITPDHRGLVLSEHARAKRGDMVLEIDDRLIEAIEKAQRLRTQDEGQQLASNALPSKRGVDNGDGDVAARLSPREIQQRLRAGESIASLARSSGTDEAWIRRFAAPVLAEQSKVIEQARSVTFTKRGVGPSGAALGPSVAANVIDRGMALTLPEIEAGWGAYQHPEGGWHVRFTFPVRGRRQTAEWQIDTETGELTARNKLATELGWREAGRKLPQPKPAKAPAAAKRPAARKAAESQPEPADAVPTGDVPVTTPAATAGSPEPGAEPQDHAVQELPLQEDSEAPPPVVGREVSLPKPKKPRVASKPPASEPEAAREPEASETKAPAAKPSTPKRAAAAVTETPVQSVVAVPPSETRGSMPPTDLDVVDVVVDLTALDDDTAREPAPIGSPPAPPGGPPAP
jgi:hypothetical protein